MSNPSGFVGGPTPTVEMRSSQTTAQTVTSGSSATIVYDTLTVDSVDGLALATGIYTVPLTGRYLVSASVVGTPGGVVAATGYMYLKIKKNTTAQDAYLAYESQGAISTNATVVGMCGTDIVDCQAGDTLQIVLTNTLGQTLVTLTKLSTFSLCKIG